MSAMHRRIEKLEKANGAASGVRYVAIVVGGGVAEAEVGAFLTSAVPGFNDADRVVRINVLAPECEGSIHLSNVLTKAKWGRP